MVSLAPRPATPAAWIAPEGANAAIVADGHTVPLRTTQKFGYELWSRRRGFAPLDDPGPEIDRLFACGRDSCIPTAAPVRVAGWWRRIPPSAAQLAELCSGAEVVVLRTGEGSCPGRLVLGQQALAAGGAAELYRTAQGWRVTWAQPLRGERPWSRQIGEAEE